jgi:hypothetical protein
MERGKNTGWNGLAALACALLLLYGIAAKGQVNTQEPATNVSRQNTKNAMTPVPAEAEAESAAPAGVMTAQGYLAVFTRLQQDAQRKNRYKVNVQQQKQLDQVVEKLSELYPQSFEYHYAAYLNARLDTAAGHHLLEAYRLARARSDLLDDLASLSELKGDHNKKLDYCRQLDQKKVYDPLLYTYAMNLFLSLEQGAILFTQGEWDTHPLWVLQNVRRLRTDVTILQLDLLHQELYFNRMMAPLKLKKGAYQRFVNDKPAFFREVAAAKSSRPVYLSISLDQELISSLGNILYTTGLAMKLSDKPFDNVTVLLANWKSFDITAITTRSSNPDLNRMNGNYILPMGVLYRTALTNGNTAEADKLKQMMLAVAGNTGKRKEMEGFFD